ncbi:unnamed protein product, partial [Brassica oleracea]
LSRFDEYIRHLFLAARVHLDGAVRLCFRVALFSMATAASHRDSRLPVVYRNQLIALRGKTIKQQGSCGEDPVPVASGENDAKVPAVFFIEAVKAWGIEQHVLPHWRGFQHVLVSS